jgi:hypothetical protein
VNLTDVSSVVPNIDGSDYPIFMFDTQISQYIVEQLTLLLKAAIRNKQIRIHSTRFGEEMEHFIWTGKRGQALKNKHDDLIMALAIGLQAYNPFGGFHNVDNEARAYAQAFIAGISRRSSQYNPNPYLNQLQNTSPSNNPYLTGEKPNPFLSPKKAPTVNGIPLRPGVKKEHVELDMAIRNEFDWLFK